MKELFMRAALRALSVYSSWVKLNIAIKIGSWFIYLIPANKRTLTFALYIQYSLGSNLRPRPLRSHDRTGEAIEYEVFDFGLDL